MCGIAGLYYFDNNKSATNAEIEAMISTMTHRGPDDGRVLMLGNVALGHRRLSIIDLEAGIQPMSNIDCKIHIVFNGEIYNYIDLRNELQRSGCVFKTQSDTEVLLKCYEFYGESFINKINGMFAFAIWDELKRKLFLGRDRVGKKPLYYFCDNNRFIFSSEIKAILAIPGIPLDINLNVLDNYFSYMYIPEPASIFKGIKKLRAAHTMQVNNKCFVESRYWRVPDQVSIIKSEGDYADELASLLEDAVRIRMISDVPIGVFLSGGIDSTSITGLMAGISPTSVKTFSIGGGENEFNELPYARVVADYYSTEHREFQISTGRLEETLSPLIKFFDEPFGDSSMLPTYHVSKIARQHVKVALSGEGGDELFAGYDWHNKFNIIRKYKNIIPEFFRENFLLDKLPNSKIPVNNSSVLSKFLFKLSVANRISLGEDSKSYEDLITSFSFDFKNLIYSNEFKMNLSKIDGQNDCINAETIFSSWNNGTLLEKALRTDIELYLTGDLLTKVDRMSMANSLEVRSPLLDYRIIELASRIPENLKVKSGVRKYILRRAMDKILPIEIKERKTKRGFSVPVDDWFRNDEYEYARSILLDRRFVEREYFDQRGIESVLNRHRKGSHNYGQQIWSLLVFALWTNQYLS